MTKSSAKVADVKNKYEKTSKNVINWFYPLCLINSLTEKACLELLFDKYDNWKSILSNLLMNFMLFVIVLNGFQIPLFIEYRPFRSKIFGNIGEIICAGQSFICAEIIILRTWSFFAIRKYHSTDKFPFVHFMKKLKSDDHEMILFSLQLASILVNTSSIIGHFIILFFDLYHSADAIKYILFFYYIIGYTLITRNGAAGVMIMFTYSLAGFKVVYNGIKQLNSQITLYPSTISQVLFMYESLTSSVGQLTFITRILMLTSNLLIVPTFSLIIIFELTPVPDVLTLVTKIIFTFSCIMYSIRGYFLVAIMSKIASESKTLFVNINSIIARSLCESNEQVKRVNMILEDISCSKSRIVIREFNSTINQMDFLNSILLTASNVILIFSLAKSVSFFQFDLLNF